VPRLTWLGRAPLYGTMRSPRVVRRSSRRTPAKRPTRRVPGQFARSRSAGAPDAATATLLSRVSSSVARELRRRVPRADLDERDPDYIRDNLPFLWMLSSLYFRADVRGLDNIPEEGPVLLVGNHSGGNMIVDTFVFSLAFNTRFGVERRFYQLAHNLVLLLSGFFPWLPDLRKFGKIGRAHV